MNRETLETADILLDNLAQVLDISEAQYKMVEERYNAVASHLAKDTSLLKPYKPTILPQGSFLLGTMIKPINEHDQLDVDLVCRLQGKKSDWAQYHLKQEVGDQIKADAKYREMLSEEGKRCWTLEYAESTQFHMDILPALVNQDHFILLEKAYSSLTTSQIEQIAIKITDNTLDDHRTETDPNNWPKSNPFGYAGWFKQRASTAVTKAFTLNESVDPLPKYEKDKEPLVRVVQILKRHRDIMFGKEEHKPISIIITTLAAKAYNKEGNISGALRSVLTNMESGIEPRIDASGKKIKWIGNPVNDQENFADKWVNEHVKEQYFYAWLEKARSDFAVLESGNLTSIYRLLKTTLGSRAVNDAYKAAGLQNLISENYYPIKLDSSLLSVPHREALSWPTRLTHNVEVHANFKEGNLRKTITPDTVVPKFRDIYFTANTSVRKPYDVYWQVVNTGEEAQNKQGLRGKIFKASTAGAGGLYQKEYSEYKGAHWIECFIVKDGTCVARSSEFFVNIE